MTLASQATDVATHSSFNDLPLTHFLQETIRTVGYTTPTPIQAAAIPVVLEGRDLIGIAQTGTGKTAAFVLPLLQKLSGGTQGTRALVLAPTRELAEQINDVIKAFSGRTGLRSVTVYGGVSHRNQITQLARRPQIVVACPGRLMDHIRGKTIDLSKVEFLVLDEADRMLDMGFLPDVKSIIKELSTERQTLFFSATMPEEIAELSASVLSNPHTIRVRAEQPVALVEHAMYSVKQDNKGDAIASWLRGNTGAVTVVFTKMKHTAKRLGDRLTKAGIPAVALHGNLSQAQRQRALQGFRDGRFKALVATDIASRGIDVEGVTHVVNYDMPDTLEAYIHRTGRAGRASKEGHAVSFVTRADRGMIQSIERWLKTPLRKLNTETADGNEADAGSEERGPRERRTHSRQEREVRGRRQTFGDKNRRAGPRGRDAKPDGRADRREGRSDSRDRTMRRNSRDDRRDGRNDPREQDVRFNAGDRRRDDRHDKRSMREDRGGRWASQREGSREGNREVNNDRKPRFSDRGDTERRPFGRSDRNRGRPAGRGGSSYRTTGEDNQPRRSSRNEGRSSAFRGQRDIDPNSERVFKEKGSYYIDRGEKPSTPRRDGNVRGQGRRGQQRSWRSKA